MNRAPTTKIAAIAATVLAMGAGAAFAAHDDDRPGEVTQPHVSAVEPAAAEALSVLRQPREAGDRLPERVEAALAQRAPFGLNPALSRRAVGGVASSVYVMPARDHVCVSLTIGGGTSMVCPSVEDVAAGRDRGGTVSLPGGDIALFGIVPDGVDEVEVGIASAQSVEVPVEGNAYHTVLAAGTPLRSLRYSGPSGPVEFSASDPAGAFEGR